MAFLAEELKKNSADNRNIEEVANIFKEMKPETIRNSLKKMWL